MDVSDKISWFKTSATTWSPKTQRGFDAEITYTAGIENPYEIVINPGAVTSQHATFRNAKNAFRKYLLDKPVS